MWDARTGHLAASPMVHPDWVFHAEFNADSRLVVTACRDKYVRVWDWRTGRLVGSPSKHSSEVKDARFLRDGYSVVSLESERTPRISSLRTGRPLAPARDSRIQGYQLLITPDDHRAIVAGFRPWLDILPLDYEPLNENRNDRTRRQILAELVSGQTLNLSGGPISDTSGSGSGEIVDKMATAGWLARWDSLGAGQPAKSLPDGEPLNFATDRHELAHTRGNNFAELGRWDLAVAEFKRATEGHPEDFEYSASLRLIAPVGRGCHRLPPRLRSAIEQFGTTRDERLANDVASLCVLLPDALSDHGSCLRLAELAATRGRGYHEQNTLGTVLYRAGYPEKAITQLTKAAESHGTGGTPYDWLFLAMAHSDLGQPLEARRHFSRAKDWLERASRGEQPADPYLGRRLSWVRRSELHRLLKEAEARLRE